MLDTSQIFKDRIKVSPELRKQFWDGNWNKLVRHYFYVNKGLQLFNEFRYVVMTVGIIYAFLRFDNILLLPLMFFGFIPFLDFFGWLSVHKMDRITEFLQTRYATHYSHYNIELQEEQLRLLKEIKKCLKSG
jgi:hypothetical protein